MKYFVTLPSGREHVVDIVEDATGKPIVTVDGRAVEAEAVGHSSSAREASAIRIGGTMMELWLESSATDPRRLGVVADGRRFFAEVESERMRIRAAGKPAGAGEGIVRSPMPGRIVRVNVAVGDEVEPGASVIVVEAMKMENELTATRAGKVTAVHVAAGATVEGGAALVEIA